MIRQQIVDAIKTRFEGITVANGYSFDIDVFKERKTQICHEELPALVFMDTGISEAEGSIGGFRWHLNILVWLSAEGGTSNDDIRKMLADVYKAVGSDYTWGGLALYTMQPEGDEIFLDHEGNKITGAQVKLKIVYDAPPWEI